MRFFMIPCLAADGSEVAQPIYVGEAMRGVHPLEEQAAWLKRERGLTIPEETMDTFAKLVEIAFEHDASLAEVAVSAFSEDENGEESSGEEA